MSTATETFPSDVVILRHVPYQYYVHLTNAAANRHLKMAYHDGTLEIVSPRRLEHERPSRKLAWIVTTVARHLRIPFDGAAGTTFRKQGEGPYKGKGKEPDQSFYLASLGRLPRDREVDVDAGDPPPDLWIEVDNRVSSAGRLPVYAALGVPEVWRYRSRGKKLQFLQLVGDVYQSTERSIALPVFTPTLVLDALALGDDPFESEWLLLLEDWVMRTFPRPPVAL